jgi:pimeloyl-ACP methyl ester carboxylesterase
MSDRIMRKTVRKVALGIGVAVAATPAGARSEVEHSIVARGSMQIEVLTQGSGPAVVLLPSLGRGAEDFDDVAALIAAAGFRVIRPEPRGIGRSTGPMEGLTLSDLAEDVVASIEADTAGDRRPVIVAGHAFGNWVARAVSAVRPDLVRAVVLLAASVGTEIDPAIRPSIDGSFDVALPEEERLHHLRRGYFAAGNDARCWLGGWHPAVVRMQRAATAATQDRAWQRAADRVPVLYVAAEEDAIAPLPTLERLRQELGTQVSLTSIPRAGHALLPEQPARTAEALILFARGLLSAAPAGPAAE